MVDRAEIKGDEITFFDHLICRCPVRIGRPPAGCHDRIERFPFRSGLQHRTLQDRPKLCLCHARLDIRHGLLKAQIGNPACFFDEADLFRAFDLAQRIRHYEDEIRFRQYLIERKIHLIRHARFDPETSDVMLCRKLSHRLRQFSGIVDDGKALRFFLRLLCITAVCQ